ncbi:MAG: response regulator [Gammaproteobacteria bacterium]|nr:response regulator [Gammaproteobacteria bacterium]
MTTTRELYNSNRPRWFLAYLGVACISVFIVLSEFYLNKEVNTLYFETVNENKLWTELEAELYSLSEIVLKVNSPGNDVFNSFDVVNEWNKYLESKQELLTQFQRVDKAIENHPLVDNPEAILQALQRAKESFSVLDAEVFLVFQQIRKNKVKYAATHMALMDQQYAVMATEISNAIKIIQNKQSIRIGKQMEDAAYLKRIELTFGTITVCTIFLAIIYGVFLLRKVKNDEAEKVKTAIEMETIYNSTLAPSLIIDENGIVQSANRAVYDELGYSLDEVIGKNISILMPEPHKSQHDLYIEKYLRTNQAKVIGKSRELTVLHKSGKEIPIILSVSEMHLPHGIYFLGTIHDITEQKQEAKKLEKARISAERANKLKSEFLANMSHEIRTPMNGIMGMNALLQETELNKEQKKFTNIIRSSSETLLHLLNDILDFSKIEANKLELDYVSFELRPLLEELAEIAAMNVLNNKVKVLLNISPDVPNGIHSDPIRVRQVLHNLLNNALKFTEEGQISIDVSIKKINSDDCTLEFAVSDTGIGIDENKLSSIFDKFSQEDASTTRKYGGSGLGLAISRKLVQLMGGEIYCSSKKGKGSVFTFNIIVGKSNGVVTEHDRRVDLIDKRILVVDDNDVGREIVTNLMTHHGAIVTSVASSREAIDAVQKEKYDAISTDYMMPNMDGVSLAKELRISGFDNPIVLLSSTNVKGEVLDNGLINGFLLKPSESLRIVSMIEQLLYQSGNNQLLTYADTAQLGEVVTQSSSKEKASMKRILLVEDNKTNQIVAKAILGKVAESIEVAENGEEAFEKFINTSFDCVFMDCQMPVLDGYQATKKIREHEQINRLKKTPIIALTANAMKHDIERCYASGMDYFIAKPIQLDKLYKVINEMTSLLSSS